MFNINFSEIVIARTTVCYLNAQYCHKCLIVGVSFKYYPFPIASTIVKEISKFDKILVSREKNCR